MRRVHDCLSSEHHSSPEISPRGKPKQDSPSRKRKATTDTISAPSMESAFYGQRLKSPQRLDRRPSTHLEDQAESDNGELSTAVEHTSATHKILIWPSIKRLLEPRQYNEDYMMMLEEERGLISVYWKGEVSHTADDSTLPTPPITRDIECNGDGMSQVPNGPSEQEMDAEIDRFGLLGLDDKTARRYYQSFLDCIHKLHPFLDRRKLEVNVDLFVRCYCPQACSPKPVFDSLFREMEGVRVHEDVCGFRCGAANAASASTRPLVGRNIHNAIILLIFALGAISEYKSPLPSPNGDEKFDYRHQYIPPSSGSPPAPLADGLHDAQGVLALANSNFSLPPMASLYAPHIQTIGQSFSSSDTDSMPNKASTKRTISANRDGYGKVKNPEVFPGLSLYGFATAILGQIQGCMELGHVQACLLAGLYSSQLSHPLQSHNWIWQASRVCQVLTRPRRYETLDEDPTQDLYKFAYWTCLQLENDLLAELDLPASGISDSEGRISCPKGIFTLDMPNDLTAPSKMMMLFYSAQAYLHRILSRVQTDLCKIAKQIQTHGSSDVQEALHMNLFLWRAGLPDVMKWEDNEPPAADINVARLRAKFYDVQQFIHRPLLYHMLHYGQTGATIGSVGQPLVDSSIGSTFVPQTQQMPRSMTHIHRSNVQMQLMIHPSSSARSIWTPSTVNLHELPSRLRRACKICVKSAILSTEAFDGIGDRIVVTNIFGTAHA
jgi:hypothetical protein